MNPTQWIEMQPAYVLHARPFRETSVLLQVFCRDYGRVSLVARGARQTQSSINKKRQSRFQSALQPFVPLLLSWRGRGSLFNLTQAECNGVSPALTGRLLLGGWYMNELLLYALKDWDAQEVLFKHYNSALYSLKSNLELGLRQFEKRFLMELGIMPALDYEMEKGKPVIPDAWYAFCPSRGLSFVSEEKVHMVKCFKGNMLLAIHNEHWEQSEHWRGMRRFFRMMIDYTLNGKSLRSRDLL